jgi:hypothetical protein
MIASSAWYGVIPLIVVAAMLIGLIRVYGWRRKK